MRIARRMKQSVSRGAKRPLPPHITALERACKLKDAEAAISALTSCTSMEGAQQPTADLVNRVLRLAVMTSQPPERISDIRTTMKKNGIVPDESTLTLEVRSLVSSGKLYEAVELLTASPSTLPRPRLRTFSPLLKALCQNRDGQHVAKLEARIADCGVELAEEQLVDLAILSAHTAGTALDPATVNIDVSDDTSAPVSASQAAPAKAQPPQQQVSLHARLLALQQALPALTPASLHTLQAGLDGAPSRGGAATISARFTTISNTGACSRCGAKLAALPLSQSERHALQDALLGAADALGGRQHLAAFGEWLRARPSLPSHIIDGANVAYRNQNYGSGGFSYEQIEIARATLMEADDGKEPLIILPERYLDPHAIPNHARMKLGHKSRQSAISSSSGQADGATSHAEEAGAEDPAKVDANVVKKARADASTAAAGPSNVAAASATSGTSSATSPMQLVTPEDAALVERWRQGGGLWVAPDVVPDDWYFMYATALAGPHARVLTNDEMRDHIWQLKLGKRLSFGRWKARHVVRFDFSHASSPLLPPPKLLLESPPIYSREIQQGVRDEARASNLLQWHLPTAPAVSAANNKSPTRQSTSANETDDAASANGREEVHEQDERWLCVSDRL